MKVFLISTEIIKTSSGRVNAAAYLTNQTADALFADASDLRLEENTGYKGNPRTVILSIKFRFLYFGNDERVLRSTAENWIVYRLTDVDVDAC